MESRCIKSLPCEPKLRHTDSIGGLGQLFTFFTLTRCVVFKLDLVFHMNKYSTTEVAIIIKLIYHKSTLKATMIHDYVII